MISLYESRCRKYSGKLFFDALLEYLNKTDVIKGMPDYVTDLIEPYVDSREKRKEYEKNDKMIEIKDDIRGFIKDWFSEVLKLDRVQHIRVDKSPYFGLSNYIYVTFTNPTSPKLANYAKTNKTKYDQVKFRFTDHSEEEDLSKHKAKDFVDFKGKTFIQAANEMLEIIKNYIETVLRPDEIKELKRIKNRIRRQKRKQKDNTINKESFRLSIRESVILDERLEEISTATYATDSVGDIVNWLLNKPKPYRILYDKKYDVWVIADAMSNTHKDMSIDLFDSDYLYGVARDLDNDIKQARTDGKFNSGYTDAEVYSDYWFDNFQLKGLFFIPKNMQYRDYEESGFYSHEVPITTGSIFVQRPSEFSEHGIFKDLYNKLDRLNVLKSSLKSIYIDCRKNYGLDWLQYFYDEAEEWEYDEDEVQEFMNRYGILGIMKEV